jgi:serine phosphatase RsbU (regulator of sigma subunit)
MGHGLEATLLAAVSISTIRNARRRGLDLPCLVRLVDEEIGAAFGPDKFVTGIFAELNTATGVWTWAPCGHPPALLVRQGRVVKTLDSVIGPPLGIGLLDGDPEMADERLEPGDRLLLYTDGVIEARNAAGTFFGTERLVDFVVKEAAAGRPAAETLRRLNREILLHQEGALQDDATTVMVEWLTDEPERSTPELRTGSEFR